MYAKIINDKTKQCDIGVGTNIEFYKSIGMEEMEVEQAYDGTGAITFALVDIGAIATSAKGVANGVATLDAEGKVPSSQLPSYVDDVVEGYFHNGKFYQEASYSTEIVAMSSKIYVDLATNKTYRYGGTTYVEITSGDMVALSTTEIDQIYANA